MSHKIDRGWLFTELSCENTALKEVGVENQLWLRCGFEMKNISGFKEVGEPDEEAGKVVVYMFGVPYVLNIDYDEFVKLFMGGVK